MKFTIEQHVLVTALDHLRSVVEKRNTIPILANVLISVANDRLTLIATDLDIEVTESVSCMVASGGKLTVAAHMVYDIVRKFAKGSQVEFEGDPEQGVTIKSGRSVFKMSVLPHEDFPTMASGGGATTFVLGAAELRNMIDKVKSAISTEETRYYLNGIYLHTNGENLRAVATDGHRMIRYDMPVPEGAAAGLKGIIIPRKTAATVRGLLDGIEGDVTVTVSDTKIGFVFGDVAVLSKLIDGKFPDYERVIPQNNPHTLSIATADISAIIDRAGAMTHRGAIRLGISKSAVVFRASSVGDGTVTEDADAEWSGPNLEIGFNRNYLGELIAKIAGDKSVFALNDAGSPALLTDPGDPATLYVLMPMRC